MTDDPRTLLFLAGLTLLLVWETIQPYFEFFGRVSPQRARHLLRNLSISAINAVAVSAAFVLLWAWAAAFSQSHQIGLLHQFRVSGALHTLLAVLLLDAWTYLWHRMNHRIGLLWRFHRVHHSDVQMDVTTAGRFHFGEIAASSVLRVGVILLVGARLQDLLVYEALMFAVVQFHHANIGLPEWLDRMLRVFIVTPAMHKVHHSRLQPETDSNYTSLLSVWDRLFGTFRLRADPHTIEFGIDDLSRDADQNFAGLMKTPFAERGPTGSARGRHAGMLLMATLVAAVIGLFMLRQARGSDWASTKAMIARDFPNVKAITTAELAGKLGDAGSSRPVLLDVRESNEFSVSHLPGARQVDPDAKPTEIPADIGKSTPIVVYCSVGYRSAAMAERLTAAGYADVRNLDGSIFQWANEGRPVERDGKPVGEVHRYDARWGRLLDPGLHPAKTP